MKTQLPAVLPEITIHAHPGLIAGLTPLLATGMRVRGVTGCSIRELLCGQLGLDPDYLDHKIQTLFLDGKPVDDVDTAVVSTGAVLALSAAMPGLVGATMRKGGQLAGFRHSISHAPKTDHDPQSGQSGWIKLKLFNRVIKDLGPHFLSRGIVLSPSEILDLTAKFAAAPAGIVDDSANGKIISMDNLAKHLSQKSAWQVRLYFDKGKNGGNQ